MAKPLHILSIASLFPNAVQPRFGIFVEHSLAALAAEADVALTIIAPVGLPPWPASLHPRYRALRSLPLTENWHGLDVLRPRFILIPGMAARNAAAMARAVLPHARALQAAGKADVIDAQFFWPDGPAAAQIAQRLQLPFSIKARGSDISLWARNAATRALIMDAAADATGLLAVASTLRDDMAAIGMDAGKISVHYTGLDASQFYPRDRAAARAKMGLSGKDVLLLTVGTLHERKGQQLVLDALSHLPDHVHYWMAGDGPERAALAAQITARGLGARVRLLGGVAHADLPEYYAAADMLVLPSASEGLANVWVEAGGCGTPILLSDIPPAYEMIDDPMVGRIAARDPVAIAAGVAAILAEPPDRAALSAHTHARFNWQRNGAELAAYLRGLTA
ncbi:MAG: glycosyltransferase [Sphingomonadaceae bacterium]|nr:glycosyltransferase [Sphingomonadaceae bacterium]